MPPAKQPVPDRQPIAYGYARVSVQKDYVDDKREDLSLEAQQQKCKKCFETELADKGVRWGDVFVDEGKSAFKKKLGERKAGKVLCDRLQPGDHIIFSRLDRGFRRAFDCLGMIDRWREHGITVHILDFKIDTSTIHGRLMLGILALFAEFERELGRERTIVAMAGKKKRDGHANQHAGYGQKLIGPKGKRKVVADPDERRLMAAIVEMKDVKGMGFREIWRHFLAKSIKTREGNEWSEIRIYRTYERELQLRAKEANGSAPATSADSP